MDTYPHNTQVEYRHAATGQWRMATVVAYRHSDGAYVLRTEHGTDAAPARDVRQSVTESTTTATFHPTGGVSSIGLSGTRAQWRRQVMANYPSLADVAFDGRRVVAVNVGSSRTFVLGHVTEHDTERGETGAGSAIVGMLVFGALLIWLAPGYLGAFLGF